MTFEEVVKILWKRDVAAESMGYFGVMGRWLREGYLSMGGWVGNIQ